jgi:hypothetical protein
MLGRSALGELGDGRHMILARTLHKRHPLSSRGTTPFDRRIIAVGQFNHEIAHHERTSITAHHKCSDAATSIRYADGLLCNDNSELRISRNKSDALSR